MVCVVEWVVGAIQVSCLVCTSCVSDISASCSQDVLLFWPD